MRRFFVEPENLSPEHALLTGQQARHAVDVLRLGPGARVAVFDGTGAQYLAEIVSASPEEVRLAVLAPAGQDTESPLALTLAMALVKGKKMDFILRAATELGAAAVQPFTSARCVPRLDPKDAAKRRERWEAVAREAAKQCERPRFPAVRPLCGLRDLPEAAADAALRVVFLERSGFPPAPAAETRPESVFAVVGPEGGFAPDEARFLEEHGFSPAGLGPRILRAETAAAAACTLLQHVLGDL